MHALGQAGLDVGLLGARGLAERDADCIADADRVQPHQARAGSDGTEDPVHRGIEPAFGRALRFARNTEAAHQIAPGDERGQKFLAADMTALGERECCRQHDDVHMRRRIAAQRIEIERGGEHAVGERGGRRRQFPTICPHGAIRAAAFIGEHRMRIGAAG